MLPKEKFEWYHISNDYDELVRQTYSIEDSIPKKMMFIGEYVLPALSTRRYTQLQKEINQTSRPETILEALNQISYD